MVLRILLTAWHLNVSFLSFNFSLGYLGHYIGVRRDGAGVLREKGTALLDVEALQVALQVAGLQHGVAAGALYFHFQELLVVGVHPKHMLLQRAR